ncbi:sulfotransferase domain-containing protein [Nocardioides sp. J9]|uniref:sulfotransferase domain-containing protein n=1 Tax=unclassified Nocardioides TaxID=2615069 RepID=UPI00048D75C9|nr:MULTISPECIES: sulfotransferase domain-containing protein [unclassified Nocardioides]TWG91848.1 sulfotransferase domain-containing protein [Nocardioides sp. J9]TWG93994.1 sulfotransferase domain-containing protein [Nocardioides sp. J9]
MSTSLDPREWAARTVNWPPARTAVKRAVHLAARGRGRVLTARDAVPDPGTIIAAGPQKAGSQWIKALFDHPVVRAQTGLLTLPQLDYELTPPRNGFPAGTYVPGFYGTYQDYLALPKRHPHKVVYLGRDPRNVVVSGYWSAVETHRPTHLEEAERLRLELKQMSMDEALLRIISLCGGHFAAMASWVGADDPDVARFRLEDVARDSEAVVRAMLEHCGIELSEADLATLLRDTSKDALRAKDLAQRSPDSESHYRSRASRYQDVFKPEHHKAIEEVAPGLVELLGYEPA